MYLKMLQDRRRWFTRSRAARRPSPLDDGLGFTIRFAYPDDQGALQHLAALDSKPAPEGPLLVAEVGSELWAAVSLGGGGEAIADPFRHTAELVSLLRERGARLTEPKRGRMEPQRALRVARS
jgi:hypothetical protein